MPEPVDTEAYPSATRALIGGARDALGAPALVLGASYLGFGSLVHEYGWPLALGLFSTLATWALPAQVAVVELFGAGASLFAIAAAAALINARMLPMAVSLSPLFAAAKPPRWQLYAAAQLIAVTGWAQAMLRCPHLPPAQRLPYFVGFAGSILIAACLGTAIGFAISGAAPAAVSLGLVFVNPAYFMLVFLVDLRDRARVLALAAGAIAAPPLHFLSPDWGLLLAGLAAGTAAFAFDRALPKGRA